MDHNFTSRGYTIGIEEELMIVDAETLELSNAIEQLLEDTAVEKVKPELMESVCEIATDPHGSVDKAGEDLQWLRRHVTDRAREKGLLIGSAGTHPTAKWEDQRIVARPRYRDLIEALRFVARQELIFGMHVHVGLDDPEKAIHVANGMRVHLAILLALSANSPFWRGHPTGMMSGRTPIFRQFPRVGVPPAYHDWDDYCERIEFMVGSGVMEDYTYLWYDVRPHPKLGTVEVRVFDSQTRIEHTLGLAALVQAMVRELAEHFDAGTPLGEYPWEMLDENKWLAARYGLDGHLIDLPGRERVHAKELARRLLDRLIDHARDLGSASHFEALEDIMVRGSGAHRQLVVYEANQDLREVVAEIVEATAPVAPDATG